MAAPAPARRCALAAAALRRRRRAQRRGDRRRARAAGRRLRAAREPARPRHARIARAAGHRVPQTTSSAPRRKALERPLRADRRISELRFVPREQALTELKAVQGLAEVLAALGQQPAARCLTCVDHPRRGSSSCMRGRLSQAARGRHVQADFGLGAAPRRRWRRIGRLAVWLARLPARVRPGGRHLQHHPAADPHPARRRSRWPS